MAHERHVRALGTKFALQITSGHERESLGKFTRKKEMVAISTNVKLVKQEIQKKEMSAISTKCGIREAEKEDNYSKKWPIKRCRVRREMETSLESVPTPPTQAERAPRVTRIQNKEIICMRRNEEMVESFTSMDGMTWGTYQRRSKDGACNSFTWWFIWSWSWTTFC